MNRKVTAITVLTSLLLSGCGNGAENTEQGTPNPSGVKSAIVVLQEYFQGVLRDTRPSSPLGIFASLYLAQGVIIPAQSALDGMEAIAKVLEGQKSSTSNENFALLKEVGAVLQVDIIDTLNRSDDRVKALDTYTQSLKNAGILIERKLEELEALHDTQRDQVREQRSEVRDLERALRNVLRDQDYAEAGDIEEQLAEKNAKFAEIETQEEQTGDMIRRFTSLLEVAGERLQAVQNNREILIAGLRVIDVPGIVDLNILEEGRSWRRRGGSSIFGN